MGNDNDNLDNLRSFIGDRTPNQRELADAFYDAMRRRDREDSQAARRFNPSNSSQSFFNDRRNEMQYGPNSRFARSKDYRRTGNVLTDFETGLKDGLLDAVAGGDFKKGVKAALKDFTDAFGFELKDLPHELGKEVLKQFVGSDTGKAIGNAVAKGVGNLANSAFGGKGQGGKALVNVINKMTQSLTSGGKDIPIQGLTEGADAAADAAKVASEAAKAGEEVAEVATKAGEAGVQLASGAQGAAEGMALVGGEAAGAGEMLAVLAGSLVEFLPIIAAVVVAFLALEPAIEGTVGVFIAAGKAFFKNEETRKKRAEEGQKRLRADLEYIARQPFDILMDATKRWEQTWDANLRTIGQTQGYDKESVYALYEGYAERLRSEGLGSVISATDVVDKLSTVLNTGLSGEAAEEFAYIATKLTAAIPNQDFFSYADTYASIAANQIAQGKTQSEALQEANAQLEQFASNLLYSSRELAGGFSTGLKNSSELFRNAVQIAQSAKTGNASLISGTLTSVSAIIGSVAPDLASGLVNNVVQAAIGGNNNSSLVALRSLAGINAGNTEFLQAMAQNPQAVFSTLFSNLANMQNMSPTNYMEVAEGLADVFGIDKAAFARVDFNYLAQAIDAMNVNNDALNQNMDLLVSGQTTTSIEQMKMQEINSVILEEGLAYIVDSEAGRMIQQHMWDEQIASEMQEATYAIDIQGAALKFLEGIRETLTAFFMIFNAPGTLISGGVQMTAAVVEMVENTEDLVEILSKGAVGSSSSALYNLTTYGQDLNLVTSLVEMMGGKKGVGNLSGYIENNAFGISGNPFKDYVKFNLTGYEALNTMGSTAYSMVKQGVYDALLGSSNLTKSSVYGWGTVGKSSGIMPGGGIKSLPAIIKNTISSAAENATALSNQKFQNFLDSAQEAAKTMSYEQFKGTLSDYGLQDYDEALSTYGRSEEEIKGYFDSIQARETALQEQARKEDEQKFRDENRDFWDYESGTSGIFQTAMWLPFVNDEFKPFFDSGARFDTRMDAIDFALSNIQLKEDEISQKLGDDKDFTVISALEMLNTNFQKTFVSTSSVFQKCLSDWIAYIARVEKYNESISGASAWSELRQAESDAQNETLLALANAMNVFSADELKKLDPQMQANALLGKIVIILEAMMQQQNNQAGGLSLVDTMSALGLGITQRST